MEPLDLALGLGMPRRPVLLPNAQHGQEVFERVAPAGEAGGVDAAVVGQGARRSAVLVDNVEENGHDIVAGDGLMHGR